MYRFCRLIGTDSWLQELLVIGKNSIIFRVASIAGAAEKVCFHYTVRERFLEAKVTNSTCYLFRRVTLRTEQSGTLQMPM